MLYFLHPIHWWRDFPEGTRFGPDPMWDYYAPLEDEDG